MVAAVTLRPPTRRRERILIYGTAKIGKSSCWADILDTAIHKGYDGRFFVIDNDNNWDPMSPDYDPELWDYRDLEDIKDGKPLGDQLVTVYVTKTYEHAVAAVAEVAKVGRRGDWAFLDMLEWSWEKAQDEWIAEVEGVDPQDYFMVMRKEIKSRKKDGGGDSREFGGFDGKDWPWITRTYKRLETPITMDSSVNVVSVTGWSKLNTNTGATPDQIAQVKHVGGAWPKGQKGIIHRHDTVLHMKKTSSGKRVLTMVGDRRREHLWEDRGSKAIEVVEYPRGFTKRYLKDVVGWETRKVKG